MSAPVSEKVCIVCKQDCSKKPRTKDAQGNYVCEPCMATVQAKLQAKPAPVLQPAQPAPAHRAAVDMTVPDDELMDLLTPPPPPKAGDKQFAKMKAAAAAAPIGVEGGLKDPNVRHCPKCEEEMPGSGRICRACGHDLGALSIDKVPKHLRSIAPATCSGCGYDMRGAASDICPECGKKQRAPKNASMLAAEADARRELYRPPIVLGITGWVLTAGILATLGKDAPIAIFVMFLAWVIAIPVGVLAFWVSSLFYIEYDAPWHATALRLAGIYAAAQVPSAIGMAIGINAFGLLTFGLLILLYMQIMELELSEACMLSFVTRGVWFVAYMGLFAAFG